MLQRLDEMEAKKRLTFGYRNSLRIAILLIMANFRRSYFDRRTDSIERSTDIPLPSVMSLKMTNVFQEANA